jgi:hypothetical protein
MSNYLSLTNELLRRLNEVQMDSTDFAAARNVQALAKDAINSSIREILHAAQEWPFTLTTFTQTLTPGVGVYDFPFDTSSVDWESFYLKRLNNIDNEPRRLQILTFDEYTSRYRPTEDVASTEGYTVPSYVYQTQELRFGVTPIPDEAYQVEYKFWYFPEDLETATDVTVIPDRFKNVLIDGAMAYMMLFRSNEQSAVIHKEKFDQGIRMMRRVLMDDPISMRSSYIIRPLYFPRVI